MGTVDQDKYKELGINHDPSSGDGLYLGDPTNGLGDANHAVLVEDGEVVTRLPGARRCCVFEDFVGPVVIADQGTPGDSPWVTKDTSAAGAPTLAILGDANNGQFKLTMAANDEVENLCLYWNDELNIPYNGNPIFQTRLQLPTALIATDMLAFGLASARNDTLDTVAEAAWFRVEGANLNLLVETDDDTTNDDDNDTTVDLVAATWYEFKIDMSDLTDVKFYYRASTDPSAVSTWTELLASTTFNMSALGTNLQPVIQVQKSGGAGTAGFIIDYIEVSWGRTADP